MTNSHNRNTQKEGRNNDRNNASPNHHKQQTGSTYFKDNNGSNHKNRNVNNNHSYLQKSPSSASYFNNNHSNNSPSASSTSSSSNSNSNSNNNNNNRNMSSSVNGSTSGKQRYGRHSPQSNNGTASIPIFQRNNITNNNYHSNGQSSPSRSPSSFASPAGVSSSPPNLHFAGSKYFDAPSPNALPRPPTHWTSPSDFFQQSTISPKKTSLMMSAQASSTKRRLFNNMCEEKNAPATSSAHVGGILFAGCNNVGSDIFSHNLKLILNVQA